MVSDAIPKLNLICTSFKELTIGYQITEIKHCLMGQEEQAKIFFDFAVHLT